MAPTMKTLLLQAVALGALTLPAAAQIHLVQATPAEIGTSMMLEVTGATPGATVFLTGSVARFAGGGLLGGSPITLGSTALTGGPGLFHLVLGTANPFGTLSTGVALPATAGLLGL